MSTNAAIIRKVNDQFEVLYVHWDGYPDNMTPKLKNYSTPEQVEELFSMGDISSLGDTLTKSEFYNRDRGEDWGDVSPRRFNTKEEIGKHYITAEYMYFYENGEWKNV